MRATVEFYKDKRGDHRWRLKAGNGEILAICGQGFSSSGYATTSFAKTRQAMMGKPKVARK